MTHLILLTDSTRLKFYKNHFLPTSRLINVTLLIIKSGISWEKLYDSIFLSKHDKTDGGNDWTIYKNPKK